jgi:hypothetical protein
MYAGQWLTCNRSVPTADQILVPETLLKKRKSQEKAREERSAELEKKKKVRQSFIHTQDGIEGLLWCITPFRD